MELRYVECPRDSWQGFPVPIPTADKRRYLQRLLDAGFRHLDAGSFVSPRAVPQMADTEAVWEGLELPEDATLLGIIANERGLARARLSKATRVGFPLSVNETFQGRNANQSLEAAWALLERLWEEAQAAGLGFTVYLSMGFGNPYGEPWSPGDTARAVHRARALGVVDIALADTVGTATPERVEEVLAAVGEVAGLGLHLHARPGAWRAPVEVALARGVRWFEGALGGIGGCPFAADTRTGNLPTERLLPFLEAQGFGTRVQLDALDALAACAAELGARYGEGA